jgi:hypothetical protein
MDFSLNFTQLYTSYNDTPEGLQHQSSTPECMYNSPGFAGHFRLYSFYGPQSSIGAYKSKEIVVKSNEEEQPGDSEKKAATLAMQGSGDSEIDTTVNDQSAGPSTLPDISKEEIKNMMEHPVKITKHQLDSMMPKKRPSPSTAAPKAKKMKMKLDDHFRFAS